MQRLAVVLLSCVLVCALVGVAVLAFGNERRDDGAVASPDILPVAIDDKAFPDDAFRSYVSSSFDADKDGRLSVGEIEAVRHIGDDPDDPGVSGLGISSLEGIERFVNLETLICRSNGLTELRMAENTKLTHVDCSDNPLREIIKPSAVDNSVFEVGDNADVVIRDEHSEPSSGGDGSSDNAADAAVGSVGSANAAIRYTPAASQSFWREGDAWYSGGVAGSMGYPVEVPVEGVEDVGVDTTELILHDDHVYYLEGSNFSMGRASLCRQKLDGSGLATGIPETLVDEAVTSSSFCLLDGHLYFTASDEAKRHSALCRVPCDGGSVEKLAEDALILGTTEEHLFYRLDDAVYRADPDGRNAIALEADAEGLYGFASAADGSLALLRQASGGEVALSFFDAAGVPLSQLEFPISGAEPQPRGYWTDGETLYLGAARSLVAVDLASHEVSEIALSYDAALSDAVEPLFIDDQACWFRAKSTQRSGALASPDSVADNAFVLRYDAQTAGEAVVVASWYEQ